MKDPVAAVIQIGRVLIDPRERRLLIDGKPCVVGARAFDLLLALAEHRDRVVTKAELFDAVWPGVVVEENNLQVHVSALRKLLGPDSITTVAGRGYQLTLPGEAPAPAAPPPAAAAPAPASHGLAARLASRKAAAFAGIALAALGAGVWFSFASAPRLEGILGRQAGATDASIAVLPLVNLSADREQEYFSDGVSEDLINLLARVPQLRVIARTSSFSFKGKDLPIETIARQLKVATILEGSVRRAGDKLRITLQLVRAADSSQLWSATYDRDVGQIFQVQDEVAAAVVEQLKGRLLAAPKSRPLDPRVYPLVLRARALVLQGTPEARGQAKELLREALRIDPRENQARHGLVRLYMSEAVQSGGDPDAAYRAARAAATEALAFDPGFAPAYAELTRLASLQDNDLPAAARHLQRALALDPRDPQVLDAAAWLLWQLGRFEQAAAISNYLLAHDPANPDRHAAVGRNAILARRWDDAVAAQRDSIALAPAAAILRHSLGLTLLVKGDARGALSEVRVEPDPFWRTLGFAFVYHALGERSQADSALAELEAKYADVGAYNIAEVRAFRGEADLAFAWLEKAVAVRDAGLALVAGSSLMDSIRADPRWLPFLRRVGRAPEQLAAIQLEVEVPR